MNQNESPTSDMEESERMPTSPRSVSPTSIPLSSIPPRHPLISTAPASNSLISTPETSNSLMSTITPLTSASPVSIHLISTPSTPNYLKPSSPRPTPLISTSPEPTSLNSTSRSSPLKSSPPRSSPLRSNPPRSTRLRLTPVRLARLRSTPMRLARLRLTPTRTNRLKSTLLTSTPSTSSEVPSSITTITTAKSTPSPSTSSLSTASTSDQPNKKCKSWDPSTDFEIERIVGYHRDKAEQMWYFVKWKGWSDKYNTYEPIENMTGCNYLLMKFFEYEKPTEAMFAAKDNEILMSLDDYDVFQKLKESNFKKDDLDEFSEKCVSISNMFKKGSFIAFSKMIQREYEYIIRCLIGMCTHQDPGLFRRAQNYKIVLKMIKIRRKQLRENLALQNHINTLETTEVKIENYTDLDVFPKELTYVVDLKPGEGVVMPNDPTVGCECENRCSAKSHCCGEMASTVFAYNRYRRVRSLERFAIYECNRRCTCPPECLNRVVQHGMKVKLCIFKTESCGWGVKTLEKIPKGTFICEYVGELISDAEAVVRDIEYYKKNSSYVFDLDFSPDHDTNMYCIDATKYGNLARFINHSCDPNLVVYPVWIDCLEPNLHRLAFFARRNIKRGEELCIDYENAQDGHVPELSKEEEEKKSQRTLRTLSRIRCQCGAKGCREWVFGN